ncbi:hypothetical protein MBLNU459_g1031t1 [Dothideomycetes sp. NU459]
MTFPSAHLSHLHRADGSATYELGGYSVIGAVNGPIEVQRRDELPDEAAIEVNVRPAVGVGSPKERHLESLIHSLLRHVVLTHAHPRTLIQVTLQLASTPDDERLLRQSFALSVLPALLQASMLSLLSASIPLAMTFNAALLAVTPSGKILVNPDPRTLVQAASVHVLAFSSRGDLILDESEGSFDLDTWNGVFEEAKRACCDADEGEMDEDRQEPSLQTFVQRVVDAKVDKDRAWKD